MRKPDHKSGAAVWQWDSLGEFVAYVRSQPAKYHHKNTDNNFYGGTVAECGAYVLRGATERQQEPAKSLMDKVDAETHGRERVEWTPSPAGAFPCVPEYLQGMPEHMRRKTPQESDIAPIKLVVDVGVSQGVKVSQLTRRGAAIAALAMRLSEVRPVELWACSVAGTGGKAEGENGSRTHTAVLAVKLDICPVNLSECVAVFASDMFTRGLCINAGRMCSQVPIADYTHTAWGWCSSPKETRYITNVRDALGLTPEDIYITGGYVDEADEFMRDPVKWVNKYLDPQRDIT